jgi:hypothetical protein
LNILLLLAALVAVQRVAVAVQAVSVQQLDFL